LPVQRKVKLLNVLDSSGGSHPFDFLFVLLGIALGVLEAANTISQSYTAWEASLNSPILNDTLNNDFCRQVRLAVNLLKDPSLFRNPVRVAAVLARQSYQSPVSSHQSLQVPTGIKMSVDP
jgi:hypothetical protein